MNISEINNKIERMETELAELKTIVAQANEYDSKWKPEKGEKYYYPVPTSEDNGLYLSSIWSEDDIDKYNYVAGMVYRTKEEAIDVGKRMYYRHWYESMSDVTPQMWEDSYIPKYFAYLSWLYKSIKYVYSTDSFAQNVYFSSEEKCSEAIDKIGEDNFIRYVLGIYQ